MGESTPLWDYRIENDLAILPYISSMNLACGFHAGDPHTMHLLVDAALTAGIAIGAHPGFPDRENFGRRSMNLPPEKLYDVILYQIGALQAFLEVKGATLHHVKPHGALYNMAAKDARLAAAISRALFDFDSRLILYGLAGSELIAKARAIGLKTQSEVFADRTYQDDGSLTPRTEAGALIHQTKQAIQQVLQMVEQGTVTTITGKTVSLKAETICIHSDGAGALDLAKNIDQAFTEKGITITHV